MPHILVLWDIDHTLIATQGVGGQVYAEAFHAVTGRELGTMPPLAGRTEPVIFREALKLHGIPDSGDLFGQFADDPHTTTKGAVDEFYHTTTPLLLLAYLAPTEAELETAIRDQEEFLKLVKVDPKGLYAPTLELHCTEAGREAHNV